MRAGVEAASRERGARLATAPEFEVTDRDKPTEHLARLLSRGNEPTAVICRSDVHASAAMEAARRSGLSVPRDVSVACYGGPAGTRTRKPALTTVAVDMYAMGTEAARVLCARLDGGGTRRWRVNIPGTLVQGRSTGPAPQGGAT